MTILHSDTLHTIKKEVKNLSSASRKKSKTKTDVRQPHTQRGGGIGVLVRASSHMGKRGNHYPQGEKIKRENAHSISDRKKSSDESKKMSKKGCRRRRGGMEGSKNRFGLLNILAPRFETVRCKINCFIDKGKMTKNAHLTNSLETIDDALNWLGRGKITGKGYIRDREIKYLHFMPEWERNRKREMARQNRKKQSLCVHR